MKQYLIVYHNGSGRGDSAIIAQKLRDILEYNKVICMLYNSLSIEKMKEYFESLQEHNYENLTVVFMGGDGTIGVGVDALIKSGLKAKIAVYKAGTVNDFATYLKMPKNLKKYAKILLENKTQLCDVAKANDSYFINVACGGYFTHGVNTYNRKEKKLFGKLAYWSKNVWVVFKLKPHKLHLEVDGKHFDEELYFYLILNSSSAGGFKRIGEGSKIDDGLFDFIGIRPAKFGKLANLFLKITKGVHKNSAEIFYVSGKHFHLSVPDNDSHFVNVDTDGNRTETLPLNVDVVNKKIELIVR